MSDELNWIVNRTQNGGMSRREFIGRTAALGVSAGLASALYSKTAYAEPKKGGTIRVGIVGASSTSSLDPALASEVGQMISNASWGEQLVEMTPDGEVDMRIAEEVSSSTDLKVWNFKIRRGVEFTNGRTVTAEDVAATIKRHTDKNSKSGALGIVKDIAEVKAEGDRLEITLEAPSADLPYLLTDYHLIIQPEGGYDNPTAAIGAGPYILKTFEPGVRYVLQKNPNYFDNRIGHAETIEILVINDNAARTAALRSGQVHMINRVDPKVAKLLTGAPNVSIRRAAGRGHYAFVMHCDKAPFDNKYLRMALKYAIKRQEMVDKILGGFGSIGNDFPINEAYPLFDSTIEQREFDASKAREYYEKSGHDGSPIILKTANSNFPGSIDACNLFAASCKEIGIPLKVQLVPDDSASTVWNIEPFCTTYWNGRPTQDQMYSTTCLSTAEWNDTRFKNAKFDELLFAARAEVEEGKRKGMYSEMAHILREEGGLILPMFNEFVAGVHDEIAGWVDDPNAELMNFRAPVKCWLA